ncbi:hypothetical protein ACJMK2_015862 [Sinanodonta woodiana]|uniref:Uncharacterized protein n=1 Tax=Sinanodonta woodiana TaxID=1069815 RepID=A0ABD3UUL3_SINWO
MSETALLLPPGVNTQTMKNFRTPLRYVVIVVIIFMQNNTDVLGSSAFSQYIYSWLRKTIPSNTSLVTNVNSSVSDDCPNISNDTKGNEAEAQSQAAKWNLYFDLTQNLLTLFSMITFAMLSDNLGRKILLLLPFVGNILLTLVQATIIYFELSLAFEFIGQALSGILGSLDTFAVACNVIVADVTPPGKQVIIAYAVLEALNGISRVIGSFATGYCIKYTGFFYSTLGATALSVCGFLLALFGIPETRPKRDAERTVSGISEATSDTKSKNSVLHCLRSLVEFYIDKNKYPRKIIFWLCLIICILLMMPTQSRWDLTTLLQLGFPFCWSPTTMGYYNAAQQLLSSFLGFLLLKPLQNCLSSGVIGVCSLISAIVCYVMTGLAWTDAVFFIAIVAGAPMYLCFPIARGIASKAAGPEKQGALFAGITAAEIITRMAATAVFNTIYSMTVSWVRGFAFIVMAFVNFIALFFMVWLARYDTPEDKHENTDIDAPLNAT